MTGRDHYPMRSVAFDAAGDSGLIYLTPAAPPPVSDAKQPAQAIDLFLDDDEELEFALWALAAGRAREDSSDG